MKTDEKIIFGRPRGGFPEKAHDVADELGVDTGSRDFLECLKFHDYGRFNDLEISLLTPEELLERFKLNLIAIRDKHRPAVAAA